MIEVEKAIELVKKTDIERRIIPKLVSESLHYVLAKDIHSKMNMPPFSQSAMDGYAVCGNHKEFNVVDEIQAGDRRNIDIKDGEAVRIFTGAPVPDSATAVIMQEKVTKNNNCVIINDTIDQGKNIRPIGEQIKIGDLVFEAGIKINPSVIGLLHSIGIEEIDVYDHPKISLLVTGDELKKVGEKLEYGEIYESNAITLKTALEEKGYKLDTINYVKDDFKSTKLAVSNALKNSDLIILSGGISVGDYDFVKQSLDENGVVEVFYKVKQKPGKPLFYGKKDNKVVFALPGNPAAALTCFYIYVLEYLHKFSGISKFGLPRTQAQLKRKFIKKGDRAQFLKGMVGDDGVEILDGQSSAMLHSYAIANCLVYIPSNTMTVEQGEHVLLIMI